MDAAKLKQIFSEEKIDVTEGFVENLVGLFESAVEKKVKEKEETLEKDSKEKLEEKCKELDESVDKFVSTKVKQWINENAVSIENAAKVQIAENIFSGLKKLAEDNNIEIDDANEVLAEEVETLKADVDARIEKELQLESKITELTIEKLINEATKDLALTQVEVVTTKAKDLVFESAEKYSEGLNLIVESVKTKDGDLGVEEHVEQTLINEEIDPEVQAVLNLMK